MDIAATLVSQYNRIATAANSSALTADASIDLTTRRTIGADLDRAAFMPALRHTAHIAAAINDARGKGRIDRALVALDAAALGWLSALRHHLAGKTEHAEVALADVDTDLARYDRLAATAA